MRYPVNEFYYTVQGEARFTGTPAFFIRLQGCPVGCGWCDTKYTWPMPGDNPTKMQTGGFAWLNIEAIQLAIPPECSHVVITGGEPCLYDLRDLTRRLRASAEAPTQPVHLVQIETSGTYPIRVCPETWVTLSPKINMPGGLKVRDEAWDRADEIKWPIGKEADVAQLLHYQQCYFEDFPAELVWLQPLSQSKKATQVCVRAAKRYGFRLSLQTHKYADIP